MSRFGNLFFSGDHHVSAWRVVIILLFGGGLLGPVHGWQGKISNRDFRNDSHMASTSIEILGLRTASCSVMILEGDSL